MGEARGFPGMMGSTGCMHWQWKNCLKAWKGMFMSGHKGVSTLLLEAVASSNLWIWHAFFGVAKSNNDINILDRSPLFDEVLEGRAPEVNYTLNGQRKDVARAFGVLQSRFAIVRGPARFWDKGDLAKIMRVYIILQNMIIEDERDTYATTFGPLPSYDDTTNGISQLNIGEESFVPHENYIQRIIQIRDRQKYYQLQADLVEHIS
ncbi:uncharacterized protein LOC141700936 [Apium graveolens]|uniref:uncharacterized protein LOC141700936 n=1 Tax=Apium graveolens TaxID=4045 RepID=UPI003D791036